MDPHTPTFLLGLEQVIALVDATGKRVGNQVTSKLTEENSTQVTFVLFRSLVLEFTFFSHLCISSSPIPAQETGSAIFIQ